MSATTVQQGPDDADTPDGGPVRDTAGDTSSRRPWWQWLVAVVLVAAWVVLLFTVVFPRVEQVFNTDPTLEVEQSADDEGGDDPDTEP